MNVAGKLAYLINLIRKYGIRGLMIKLRETRADSVDREYRKNWKQYMVSAEEWKRQRQTNFAYMPLISVIVPAYETPEPFLQALTVSLLNQSYENWELCIADGSSSERVNNCLKQCAGGDKRIRYQRLKENDGISGNTNAAFAMAEGAFIGLLDHDDMLAKNALFEVVRTINEYPGCQLLYSDEDKIDAWGNQHSRPHFKLHYNRELLLHYNYFCHFLVIERSLLKAAGGLRAGYDGAQDYDLVLRLVEIIEKGENNAGPAKNASLPELQTKICHINKILYHWRIHDASTAASSLSKDYAYEAGRRALLDHFKRQGISADVRAVRGGGYYEVVYFSDQNIQVSSEELLLEEICFADFSDTDALNRRVADTSAQYLLLADDNNAARLTQKDRQRLLGFCRQRKIGIAGVRFAKHGKLVFPEEYEGLPVSWKGYFYRAVLPQNIAYVPLELCLVRREAYLAAGGISLEYDIRQQAEDFGKRIRNAGYEVVLDAGVTISV